jgi:hypothetical protein
MRLLSRPLAHGGGGARLKGARSATRCTPRPAARRRRWTGRDLVWVGRQGALARSSSAADLRGIDGVLRGQAAACGAAGHARAVRGAGTSQLHVVMWLGGPVPAHGTSSDPAVSTERSNYGGGPGLKATTFRLVGICGCSLSLACGATPVEGRWTLGQRPRIVDVRRGGGLGIHDWYLLHGVKWLLIWLDDCLVSLVR